MTLRKPASAGFEEAASNFDHSLAGHGSEEESFPKAIGLKVLKPVEAAPCEDVDSWAVAEPRVFPHGGSG